MENSEKSGYLTAQEAADELGISLPTLYSYVSRGLVRSEVADRSRRTRRYRREDVQKLKERKAYRRNPAKAVEGALHWGAPVLESAITLIVENRLYYRGHDVLHLAANHSIEAVAALIWAGDLAAEIPGLQNPSSAPFLMRLQAAAPPVQHRPPVDQFHALLPLAAGAALAGYELRPAAVAQTGARILHLLAAVAANDGSSIGGSIAQKLQRGWLPAEPQVADLINTALVLCADHELNVSSFTARCVASAGATLYQVVQAGLAALQGVKHGRNTERVEAFLKEIDTPANARAVIGGRLRRGEPVPGCGHRLYPGGDPRGEALLHLTATAFPQSPMVALAHAVTAEVFNVKGERPNIDFGLVVLAKTLNLPPGGPITLFALGRTTGWIGHAIEQYRLDRIIRPRARYVGDPPLS